MPRLLCGSETNASKENDNSRRSGKGNTMQCFGLKMVSGADEKAKYMESYTIVVHRDPSGFGFSVTGACPAKVKVVKKGSTAYQAGLCEGDHVTTINGQNVSILFAASVATIVRQCTGILVLDVEREFKHAKSQGHMKQGQAQPSTKQETLTLTSETHNRIRHEQDPCESHVLLSQNYVGTERLSAIQKLIDLETDFATKMKSEIRQYSSFLSGVISPPERAMLLQDVEKVVAISEYHAYKLREYLDTCSQTVMGKPLHEVGFVYLSKLLMLTDAVKGYSNTVRNLIKHGGSGKVSAQHMLPSNVSGFVERPLLHMNNLLGILQEILSLTMQENQDAKDLSRVVQVLGNMWNNVNGNEAQVWKTLNSHHVSRSAIRNSMFRSSRKASRSSVSSISSGSSRSSASSRSSEAVMSSGSSVSSLASSGSRMSCQSYGSAASSIESCVDPEVMEIQRRLVFSEHVQSFQVATASRHLIYAGELTHVEGDQLYVVLLSDLILLTKSASDKRLLVVDNPVLLHDIIQTDFSVTESLDFCLTLEAGIDEEWVEDIDITLTAPSMEQKYTWKNLLEQRIKVQKDFVNSENFI